MMTFFVTFACKCSFLVIIIIIIIIIIIMCPIAFWSVTLGLLYRGQTSKKWNSFLFTNPHEQAGESIIFIV